MDIILTVPYFLTFSVSKCRRCDNAVTVMCRILEIMHKEPMKKLMHIIFFSQDIRPMRDQIVRVKRFEKVPLILVGNKVDLESEREVAGSDGRALAQEWGCPFIETSAKSKTMVDELFAEIVRQMNYSTLPEKQEQCCTACVVQWGRGRSTSIPFLLCMVAFFSGFAKVLASTAQLATH